MKIDFYNCPEPEKIQNIKLPKLPDFAVYKPDFSMLREYAKHYQNYKNILVIANGGSLNPFYGFYHALKYQANKRAYFLNSQDPDYIHDLKKELKPEDTIVLAISKSGQNTQQLEETMQFLDYQIIAVTENGTPLKHIADKLHWKTVQHPPIGGRYTGLTEVALLPAAICGLDAEALYDGAKTFYGIYDKQNLAFIAASIFYSLEQKGFTDVFVPIYSHYLSYMSGIITQLCHESFGKAGKGQSYFVTEAPEWQHYSTQRFFGGPKNACGLFVGSDSFLHPTKNIFPTGVHSVEIRGRHIFDIDKVPLETALQFELEGNLEDAKAAGIPVGHLSITGFSAREIGTFAAFWQLCAFYGSVLRGVNPFDQPEVENSKNISFQKRLKFKGIS